MRQGRIHRPWSVPLRGPTAFTRCTVWPVLNQPLFPLPSHSGQVYRARVFGTTSCACKVFELTTEQSKLHAPQYFIQGVLRWASGPAVAYAKRMLFHLGSLGVLLKLASSAIQRLRPTPHC